VWDHGGVFRLLLCGSREREASGVAPLLIRERHLSTTYTTGLGIVVLEQSHSG
jgi:hypothetical protein